MNLNNKVLFITHGGISIGGGHVSRCLAIAEAFGELKTDVMWLADSETATMLYGRNVSKDAIYILENIFTTEIKNVMDQIAKLLPSYCIIDSYKIISKFIKNIRKICPVLLIDDCRNYPIERESDSLLNYNIGADRLGYETNAAHLLIGPGFTPLKKAFWELVPQQDGNILIMPGASDLLDVSETILRWWSDEWSCAEIIVGPLVPSEKARRLKENFSSRKNILVTYNPPKLPSLMAHSRMIICTSSVTCYEALSLKKPLGIFQVAKNQIGIGNEIMRQKLGYNLGFWGTWGRAELSKLIETPPESIKHSIVNPKGAIEIAKYIISYIDNN
jgi:UDP-2,4-diacetamido-2,4,6-trideoxy-beta-L-altropyranose hydrolase